MTSSVGRIKSSNLHCVNENYYTLLSQEMKILNEEEKEKTAQKEKSPSQISVKSRVTHSSPIFTKNDFHPDSKESPIPSIPKNSSNQKSPSHRSTESAKQTTPKSIKSHRNSPQLTPGISESEEEKDDRSAYRSRDVSQMLVEESIEEMRNRSQIYDNSV
jgi:hypothetical protein